jgi:hypothetical protein
VHAYWQKPPHQSWCWLTATLAGHSAKQQKIMVPRHSDAAADAVMHPLIDAGQSYPIAPPL